MKVPKVYGIDARPGNDVWKQKENPEWENYTHAIDFVYVDNWSYVDSRDPGDARGKFWI